MQKNSGFHSTYSMLRRLRARLHTMTSRYRTLLCYVVGLIVLAAWLALARAVGHW